MVYSVAIWYLWIFGIFVPVFWYVVPRKIWQPKRGLPFYAHLERILSFEESRPRRVEPVLVVDLLLLAGLLERVLADLRKRNCVTKVSSEPEASFLIKARHQLRA
jgi:hypothetical protein